MKLFITLTEIKDHYYHSEPDIIPIVDEFYKSLRNDEK